jgi:hypothetical protein
VYTEPPISLLRIIVVWLIDEIFPYWMGGIGSSIIIIDNALVLVVVVAASAAAYGSSSKLVALESVTQ